MDDEKGRDIPITGDDADEADAQQEAADAADDAKELAQVQAGFIVPDTDINAQELQDAVNNVSTTDPGLRKVFRNLQKLAQTVAQFENAPAELLAPVRRLTRGLGGARRDPVTGRPFAGRAGKSRRTISRSQFRNLSKKMDTQEEYLEPDEDDAEDVQDDSGEATAEPYPEAPPPRHLTEAQPTAQMAADMPKRRVTPKPISTKKQRTDEGPMEDRARPHELVQPPATETTPVETSGTQPQQQVYNLAMPPVEESKKRRSDTENKEDIKRRQTEDSPEVVDLSDGMVFRDLPQNQAGVDPDFFNANGFKLQSELYSKLLKTRSVVFGVPYEYTAQTFSNMKKPERYEILQNLATTEPNYEKINNLLNVQHFKDYSEEAKQVTAKLIAGLKEQYEKDRSERTERTRIAEEQNQKNVGYINKLNKDLEGARTQLEKYEKSDIEMREDISALQAENIKLGKDKIKLAQDKLTTEATKDRARKRIRQTEEANQLRIGALREEINNLKAAQQAYVGLEAQIGNFKRQENEDKQLIDTLDAKLADARNQIRDLQAARESVDNLQQEMQQDERRETSLPGGEMSSLPTNLENLTPEQIAALGNQASIYRKAARLERDRRHYETALEARQRGIPTSRVTWEKERRARDQFEASRARPMQEDDSTAARRATAEHIRAGIALADAEADKKLSDQAKQANMTMAEYKRWKDKEERRTRMDEDFDRKKLFELSEKLVQSEKEKEGLRQKYAAAPWAQRGGGGGRAAGRSRKRTWGGISKGFSLHDLTGIPSIHAETKDDAVLNITARRLFSTLRPTMNRYRTVPGAPYTADMLARAYAESSLPSLSGTKVKKRKYKFRKDRGIDPILRDWNLARPKALREYMQQQSQRR